MPLTPDVSRQADKFLDRLLRFNAKHARQVLSRIDALCEEPAPPDTLALKGLEPYRRAISGEYRIVYFVDGEMLRIIAIGRRNDDAIYRDPPATGLKDY